MLAGPNSTISFEFDAPVTGFAADWTGSGLSVGDNALDVSINGRSLIPSNQNGVDDGFTDAAGKSTVAYSEDFTSVEFRSC